MLNRVISLKFQMLRVHELGTLVTLYLVYEWNQDVPYMIMYLLVLYIKLELLPLNFKYSFTMQQCMN